MLFLINKSKRVSDADVMRMANAIDKQIVAAAHAWGRVPVPVATAVHESQLRPGHWALGILDDSDQADALGWHTESDKGVIYGRAFASPVLDNGGGVLDGQYSVSATGSHEAVEMFLNPHCNMEADNGQGLAIAFEGSDTVEDQSYVIDGVAVSDFVLPKYFDPEAPAGSKFDYMGVLTLPFSMTSGGYCVVTQEGQQGQQFGHDTRLERVSVAPGITVVFGPDMPQWRRETKLLADGRTAHRVRQKGLTYMSEAPGAFPSGDPAADQAKADRDTAVAGAEETVASDEAKLAADEAALQQAEGTTPAAPDPSSGAGDPGSAGTPVAGTGTGTAPAPDAGAAPAGTDTTTTTDTGTTDTGSVPAPDGVGTVDAGSAQPVDGGTDGGTNPAGVAGSPLAPPPTSPPSDPSGSGTPEGSSGVTGQAPADTGAATGDPTTDL